MGKDSTVVTVIRNEPLHSDPGEMCLVVIYGDDLGKRYTLVHKTTVIGRSESANIELDDDAVSRNHALIVDAGDHVMLKDLDSTNGTYMNDARVSEVHLKEGDLFKIGGTIFKFLTGANIEASYYEELYRLNTVDNLTSVYNRRFALEQLDREMSRSLRYGRSLAVVMVDVDHFKSVNDNFGHLTGDAVLKQIATRLRSCLRRDDLVGRYGGEEFIIVSPESSRSEAIALANRVREAVSENPCLFDGKSVDVTVSAGVADMEEYLAKYHGGTVPHDGFESGRLVALADGRLLEAKSNGRDQVV